VEKAMAQSDYEHQDFYLALKDISKPPVTDVPASAEPDVSKPPEGESPKSAEPPTPKPADGNASSPTETASPA
ncbi:MAG: hypothetical protein ACERKU_08750, partial [Nitrospirota bacterium]